MHVMVIGAGVMGVSTAYFLQKHGCQVSVIDAHASPARVCSYANGGFLSAGLSAPWSAPGAIGMAFRAQFDKAAAFKWKPDFSLRQITWMMQSLKECHPSRFAVNRARLTRLAMYALDCLRDIEEETGIDFQRSHGGVLQVYREPIPKEQIDGTMRYLDAMHVPCAFLSREQTAALEPALARSAPNLFGALHLPNDYSGDCEIFTRALADVVQAKGGTFLWNTAIDDIVIGKSSTARPCITHVNSRGKELKADAYVFATGIGTPSLLRKIVNVPVYPIKGYSMSAQLKNPDNSPRHSMFDFASKTGMAVIGDQIRVSGIAEVVGYDDKLSLARCEQLASIFESTFPDAADLPNATFWTGLRPATPDGVPFVSRSSIDNVFINTGHGGSGWSMSCGSSKLMADIVMGHTPDIAAADYELSR
jgi:D-amino-acid dehydrogenase